MPDDPMTAFERCWAFLQRPDIEGGSLVSDDPSDHGGLTKWGISQQVYPDIDIRSLTEPEAQVLFRRDYWDVCRCDDLPPGLAIAVADSAFNQGPGTAIRLLQRALRVATDGFMGPITIQAAQVADTARVNEFLSQRLLRYADGQSLFRHGWFLRVLRLKDAIAWL